MANWTRKLRTAFEASLVALIGAGALLLVPLSAYAADGYEPMGFYTKAGTLGPYSNFRSDHWATDGNIAYCLNLGQLPPTDPGAQTPTTYTNGWSWENEVFSAIALNGYPNTTVIGGTAFDAGSARAATQIAVWMAAGQVDDAGKGMEGTNFASNSQKREIVRAAAALKNDAVSGKLKAPRYTKRYYGGMRKGQKAQDMLWVPLTVEIGFTKSSADASVTDGNDHYAYAGASYDIFRASDDTKVASITTDDSGHASCALVPGVSYYAVETKAPAGFECNEERIPFTATAGANVTLSDRPGTFNLTVSKRDSATGAEAQVGATLEGAEFRLTSLSTQGFERTATTDQNGCITFDDVPLGTIRVVETKAPRGYKLDSTVHEYTVTAEDFAQGSVSLVPESDFLEHVVAFDVDITKFKDDATQEGSALERPAEGVAFDIISNTSKDVVCRIVTDRDGKATTAGQWYGNGKRPEGVNGALPYDAKGYTVHEVEETVPEGYERIEGWEIGEDQMVDGVTLSYIARNRVLSSHLRIVKEDADTGLTVPLAGFSFQILGADGKPITQESWYPSHETLDYFTSDENGTVTLPQQLTAGSYRVHEITAQPPYVLAGEDVSFKIGEATESADPLVTIHVQNEQALGRAKIVKFCAEDGGKLAGAEFDVVAQEDVTAPDGTVWATAGQVVSHVTTAEDGVAVADELRLGSGTARYAFVETKPAAGHVLDATPVPFELTYADSETEVVTASVEVENEPTIVEIDKSVLGTDEVLPGATFELWDSADEVDRDDNRNEASDKDSLMDAPLRDGIEPKRFTTDENGRIRIDHLEAGTYRLREVTAPDGFIVNPTVWEFTIDAAGCIDGQGSHRIEVTDDYTKVEISKRDITDESEISGANLELRDADENVIDTWISGDEPHRIERLKPGTYTLRELRTPRHHDVAEDVTFTVEETGEIQKVAMYDRPISIKGELDKRQEIADPTAEETEANGDGENRAPTKLSENGDYRYLLDFRSASNTWTDEFTVTDELTAVKAGLAELTGIETPIAQGDFDGKLNVWFQTDRQDAGDADGKATANATRDDGHENPWLDDESTKLTLGDDGRAVDYTGWRLWRSDIPADQAIELSVADLALEEGEQVVAIRWEYGRVEEGFTTRKNGWDRDDIKHEHDDVADADSCKQEENLASAVIRMRVTDRYVAETELENAAHVDLYRNGGGDNLEDHDEDRVVQVPRNTALPLPQTGALPIAGLLALASTGTLAWRRALRKKTDGDSESSAETRSHAIRKETGYDRPEQQRREDRRSIEHLTRKIDREKAEAQRIRHYIGTMDPCDLRCARTYRSSGNTVRRI